MASGCIINIYCPVCHEIVWEDDWFPIDDVIIHEECVKKYKALKKQMSLEHYETIGEIAKVEIEIADLENEMNDNFKYYKYEISKLEKKLERLKNEKNN